MPERRCELTELFESQCAHCRGVGYNREYRTTQGPETWPVEPDLNQRLLDTRMEARYPGTCPVCLDRIREGDMIDKFVASGEWKHSDCIPGELR